MVMKKLMKIVSLCIVGLLIVPVTMAYYTDSVSVENMFNTIKPIGVGIEEKFEPVNDWLPGESKQKEVWFTNPTNVPILIRMSYKEGWYDMQETITNLNVDEVTKKWTENLTNEWTRIGDYYYYNHVLTGNGKTNPVLDKLILGVVSNDGHALDYSDANYKLEFIVEGCRVDSVAANTLFGVNATIENESVKWLENK